MQIFELVAGALAAAADPRLADLTVVAVVPAPNASRLRVMIAFDHGTPAQALSLVHAARGYLRAEIAVGIHRKRVPELCFTLAPLETP